MNLIGSWDLESKGIFIPVREAQQLSPRPASRQISDGFEWPAEFKQAGKTAETPRKRSDSQARKCTANQCPKVDKERKVRW